MKTSKLLFIGILFVLCGCSEHTGYIEQKPRDVTGYSGLSDACNCKCAIVTQLWLDEDIVLAYYDNPDSTELIAKHKKQAEMILLKYIKKQ